MIRAIADRHGLDRRRGRLPGARRDVPRPAGRQLRARGVQPLRDEEHDDRPRAASSRPTTTSWPTGCGSTATRGCGPATSSRSLGFNFRMTDLDAAIGLVQLAKLERNTARRQAIAAALRRGASPTCRSGLPVTPDGRTHVFHQYTLDVGAGPRRDRRRPARGAASGADIYYPIPVHRQAYIHGARPPRRPAGDRRGPPPGRSPCRCSRA